MTAPTRRAALTALAGVSALAIPKTARALSSGHGDAELFALQAEIEAADRSHDAALDAQAEADSAYLAARRGQPQRPQSTLENETWFQEFAQRMRDYTEPPSPEWDAYNAACAAWEKDQARLQAERAKTAAQERSAKRWPRSWTFATRSSRYEPRPSRG
jgi:hypothetical protein